MNLQIRRLIYKTKCFNKKLINIQQFRFFGFDSSNNDFVDKNNQKGEEYHEVEEKLPFVKGKILISQSKTNEIKIFKFFQFFLIMPINLFFCYKSIKSILLVRPIRTIFWGALCVLLSKTNYGIHTNLKQFVDKIYLLEDGLRSEFTFFNSHFQNFVKL